MRHKVVAAVCAVGSLLSAVQARGGDDNRLEQWAADINACALLSPTSISQVIGFPVEAGVRRDTGYAPDGSYSSTCLWMVERERAAAADPTVPFGGRSFVILNVRKWPDGSGLADTFLQTFQEAAEKGDIPGDPSPREFGDAALWWGDGLAVQKRDVGFGLSVVMPGASSKYPGEREEELAPQVLQRLEESIRQPDDEQIARPSGARLQEPVR